MRPTSWSALALAALTFCLAGLLTDWFHDLLFLSHTSIQDNVEVCNNGECSNEDGVRAYVSSGWALAGNIIALLFLAARGALGLLIYLILDQREDFNIIALLAIPAMMAAVALIDLPYWFYEALRIAVFICCGFLSIDGWRRGMRILPLPLGLLALIFNPIFEFRFPRTTWLVVDATGAILLFGLAACIYFSIGDFGAKPPPNPPSPRA